MFLVLCSLHTFRTFHTVLCIGLCVWNTAWEFLLITFFWCFLFSFCSYFYIFPEWTQSVRRRSTMRIFLFRIFHLSIDLGYTTYIYSFTFVGLTSYNFILCCWYSYLTLLHYVNIKCIVLISFNLSKTNSLNVKLQWRH